MPLRLSRLLVLGLSLLWCAVTPSVDLLQQESLRDVSLAARKLTPQGIPALQKGAESGDAGKQNLLGVAYRLGTGVPIDYAKALYWLRKAAEQGDAEAQRKLNTLEKDRARTVPAPASSGAPGLAKEEQDVKSRLQRWLKEQDADDTMQANEQAALFYLNLLDGRQMTYASRYPERGFACSLDELRTLIKTAGGAEQAAASSLAWDINEAKKIGYAFTISCASKSEPQRTYQVLAVPTEMGRTGQRIFCSDETGWVSFSTDKAETCLSNGEPVNEARDARDTSPSSENSAIFSLHVIMGAQLSYRIHYWEKGYTCNLSDLRMPAEGKKASAEAAGLLTAELAAGTKNGYRFTIICPEPSHLQQTYRAAAVPTASGNTGQRIFCFEQPAGFVPFPAIKFSNDGKVETCFATGTPLPAETFPNVIRGARQPQKEAPVDDRGWKKYSEAGEKAYQQGQYGEAEKQFLAAALEAIGFGPANQQLAATLNKLATLYYEQKNYSEAEPLYLRAFKIWDKLKISPEDPNYSRSLHNLVALYHAQSRQAEIERLRKVVPIFYEIKGTVANGRYTSPDGSFQVALPPLAKPGASVADRQVDAKTTQVVFKDDSGRLYSIRGYDNEDGRFSHEGFAAGVGAQEGLREKEFITTARGRELRTVRVSKGGSFIVQRRSMPGKDVSERPEHASILSPHTRSSSLVLGFTRSLRALRL